ncbi:MotA/TolQ/ExbB proton channel family protein [Persephonella atlantica]|uniref:MotA/TolQ/ExbB proton channel family protein n=1 Tax=Persephonella atlantica TaxID=2699429 RepID=A0ABS1GJY4_9AQUI|nr:MotA/TolQ/ExbB proton channel family protein [Persephonella atlantica]MBK3333253.1 MotA/TolQ/ExbB proton channel family protein [Persephonella atlantica]
MEYIIQIFQKGGPIMYPLLFLGVLSVAFILERLYSLSFRKTFPVKKIEEISFYIQENRMAEAITIAKNSGSVATNLIAGILEAYIKGRKTEEQLKVAAEEIARAEIPKLEGYVNAIGAIAAIAPLLGFLGTVTGMIQVFEALSVEGLSNPEVLSSGISQALITTAFGLSIAIPSLAAYWYFKSKLSFIVSQLENLAVELVYQLLEKKEEGNQ